MGAVPDGVQRPAGGRRVGGEHVPARPVWTEITETWWAMTSCSSRAIWMRSSMTARRAFSSCSRRSCRVSSRSRRAPSPATQQTMVVTVTKPTLSGPMPGSASRVPQSRTSSAPTAHLAETRRSRSEATVYSASARPHTATAW
ncbi:hypothetical protein ADK59_30995 [Streptomyces sp. XY332]|nr:hypothetical protein ADK59_30995 [Streptomyces sp. XY332]